MLSRRRVHRYEQHPHRTLVRLPAREQIETAAAMFRALGDPERLRLLVRLAGGEACVSELAEEEGVNITTVSARLKALHAVRLVKRRRDAKHVFYTLVDEHVPPLVRNAIDHAAEGRPAVSAVSGHGEDKEIMTACTSSQHRDHEHQHGPGCGHPAVRHAGHVDYLHDGHLHHPHEGHVDEHVIEVSSDNPNRCTSDHSCGGHEQGHMHGPGCGHEAVPHGDHVDYRVGGHLHHPHGNHCDDHGPLPSA